MSQDAVPAYRAAIVEYIEREARPREKYGHQPRLYALTKQVGEGEEYDDEIVFAAAWLHDLGVFEGHRPEDREALARWDHVPYTIEKAREILTRFGFPGIKIPAVLEVIATHQPKDSPTSMEGLILRDADILEQLGAIGILRTVCKVGRDTRFSTFTDAVASLQRSLENLPDQLWLPASRRLAEERVRMLEDFRDAVDDEAGEDLH
jgi:uncharacterized protein